MLSCPCPAFLHNGLQITIWLHFCTLGYQTVCPLFLNWLFIIFLPVSTLKSDLRLVIQLCSSSWIFLISSMLFGTSAIFLENVTFVLRPWSLVVFSRNSTKLSSSSTIVLISQDLACCTSKKYEKYRGRNL